MTIFAILQADAALLALIGDPVKAYPFGEAPQDVEYPYVTWQTIAGSSYNFLGDRPDADEYSVQFDVWARDSDSATTIANQVRYAVETHCNLTAYNGDMRDPVTMSYRASFTTTWQLERSATL